MDHELRVLDSDDDVAAAAAGFVADLARSAVAEKGRFTFAVSGGRTPWTMFGHLAREDVPWERIDVFQVDERVAPPDDPDRNLAHLRASLGDAPAVVHAMPVEAEDLDAAARQYAATMPERFDLVHLGLGPDGHTASLVPGDAVLEVRDRAVALTAGTYQGRRRMTLTFPTLDAADQLLWLVTGAEKRTALSGLLGGNPAIPAARVRAARSLVICDRSARPNI